MKKILNPKIEDFGGAYWSELDQEQQNEYQNEYARPWFLHEEIMGFSLSPYH